jgi:hypothetical protein
MGRIVFPRPGGFLSIRSPQKPVAGAAGNWLGLPAARICRSKTAIISDAKDAALRLSVWLNSLAVWLQIPMIPETTAARVSFSRKVHDAVPVSMGRYKSKKIAAAGQNGGSL